MKLPLTSGGVKNVSIRDALVELLGKPIAESNALCIPTANYGHPMVTPQSTWRHQGGRRHRRGRLRRALETGSPRTGRVCAELAPPARLGGSGGHAGSAGVVRRVRISVDGWWRAWPR